MTPTACWPTPPSSSTSRAPNLRHYGTVTKSDGPRSSRVRHCSFYSSRRAETARPVGGESRVSKRVEASCRSAWSTSAKTSSAKYPCKPPGPMFFFRRIPTSARSSRARRATVDDATPSSERAVVTVRSGIAGRALRMCASAASERSAFDLPCTVVRYSVSLAVHSSSIVATLAASSAAFTAAIYAASRKNDTHSAIRPSRKSVSPSM